MGITALRSCGSRLRSEDWCFHVAAEVAHEGVDNFPHRGGHAYCLDGGRHDVRVRILRGAQQIVEGGLDSRVVAVALYLLEPFDLASFASWIDLVDLDLLLLVVVDVPIDPDD